MSFRTRELSVRVAPNPTFLAALAAVSQGRMEPSPGGVPIMDTYGEVLGDEV